MKTLRHLQLLGAALGCALTACSSSSSLGNGSVPNAGVMPARPPQPALAALRPPKGDTGYLYAENQNSTISAFAIGATGALTPVSGSPYTSDTNGPALYSIAVDPKGPYLYATGTASANVATFAIGSGGKLTPLSDSTGAGTGAGYPLLTKSDDRLYVIDEVNGGAIAAFDVNKRGGLKALRGSPFAVGCPGFCTSNPESAVMGGSFLYSVDTYGWYVSAFSVAKNGALTELNSYATHYGPSDAVLTPNGAFLYVTNGASADISAYSVANGVLSQLVGSPFAAGGTPQGIAISSNGKYVYAADNGDGTISGYKVKAGGALARLPGSPFADGTGTAPVAVAIDKSDAHLFVTNGATQNIAVYSIAGDGKIAPVGGSPFSVGAAPLGIALYQP